MVKGNDLRGRGPDPAAVADPKPTGYTATDNGFDLGRSQLLLVKAEK